LREDDMSWTYRVIRRVFNDGAEQYGIHEVYYKDGGFAHSCTENPVIPTGDTLDDLRYAAIMWIAALRDGVVMEWDWFCDDGEHREHPAKPQVP
jgi:hypothetical protein